MFLELRWMAAPGVPRRRMYRNFARSVARRIGADPADDFCWRSFPGGNGSVSPLGAPPETPNCISPSTPLHKPVALAWPVRRPAPARGPRSSAAPGLTPPRGSAVPILPFP